MNKENPSEINEVMDGREKFLTLIEHLQEADTESDMKRSIAELMGLFENNLGLVLTSNVDEIYREMEKKKLLLRLENMHRLFDSILNEKPLEIGGGDDYYANAVVADNDAIRIALAEGEAPGPIRMLIGFNVRSAVSFDAGDVKVCDISSSELDLRNTALRAALCRHVSGKLSPTNIKHLLLRIPRDLFPEDQLHPSEIGNSTPFIFRGTRLEKDKNEGN